MSDPNSKVYANTFQTFNIYVDRAMQHLTDAELRVLLYATRHIMGWQEKITSRTGCLSLTMFEQGFTAKHEDGTTSTYGGCGLSRPVISKTLNSLESLGFLERIGYEQDKGQRWRLAEQPNWVALETRSAQKAEANQQRTSKARQSRSANADSVGNDYGKVLMSDINTPDEVVMSDMKTIVMSDVLNQTQVQTQEENDSAPTGAESHLSLLEKAETIAATPTTVEETPELPNEQPEEPTPPISAPTPSPYALMFSAVVEYLFEITDPAELKRMDAEEQVGSRAGMIASWLCGNKDRFVLGNSKKLVVIGLISRPAEPDHVRLFVSAYKAANSGAHLPWDIETFVLHWRKWASTRKKVIPMRPTVEKHERETLTPEQIAENRRLRDEAKQRAAGE